MGKIYVGNCSFDVTEQQLRDVFATFGEVNSVDVITDRDTGRPRGFAFVEMADSSSAQAAIRGLNGTDLGGRTLNVNEAKPRTEGAWRWWQRALVSRPVDSDPTLLRNGPETSKGLGPFSFVPLCPTECRRPGARRVLKKLSAPGASGAFDFAKASSKPRRSPKGGGGSPARMGRRH